jgi:flagellar FliL protein
VADKEEAEAVEDQGRKKKKMILLIVGALLLVGGAVGGTLMLMGGDNEGELQEDLVEEVVEEVVKEDPFYVDLKPAFTVNLDPEDSVGFLQISIKVLTFNEDVATELEKHIPLIRNNLIVLFGKQKSIELRSREGKEKLQKDVLNIVQSVIDNVGSGGEVDNAFFTDFVMQ